ncbi:MAG TPA: PQQ-binding-like beta-propeller repeat protein [Planctomycetota bacterium]|nr:PQQ-binding-like beta-propeller repeat protein [Planctomycetota bacterium]
MKHNADADNTRVENARAWYMVAARSAAVAGAFCAIVCALLAWNYAKFRALDPLDSPDLIALKAELAKNAADYDLKAKIREIDLRIRQQHFRAQRFVSMGSWLLAVGLGVLALSLKYASNSRNKLPDVQARREDDVRRLGALSRGAVAVLAVLALGAGVAGAVAFRGNAGKPAPGEAPAGPGSAGQQETEPQKQQAVAPDSTQSWPRFRGPGGLGFATAANVPTAWNGATGDGILWKTPVPLPGQNSPVIWGNRVFLTGADKETREVYCFDADSGELKWKQAVADVPGSPLDPPEVMQDAGYAAPTAAIDGQRVFAIFANGDLGCFDFLGRKLWARAFGNPENSYGHASSLAVYKNLLIVQFDQGGSADDGKSAIKAIDIKDGTVAWEAARPVPNSWTTPITINAAGRDQLVTAANPWVIAYNPADGSELWRAECLGGEVVPSPAFGAGLVFVCQEGADLFAIKPDGQGDVTKTHIAWKGGDGLPDICSPLATDRFVFMVQTYGMVSCYDAPTGKKLGEKDFDTEFNSSPTLVGGTVYLLDKKGVMHMFEAGPEFKPVGTAELGEESTCCPAYVDGRIYIRGTQNLYCIGARK